MAVSQTFNYSPYGTLDSILFEAWKRAGIDPRTIDPEAMRSAKSSAAYELINIPNMVQNLWLRQKQMIQIVPGQPTYVLPSNTIQIENVIATNPQSVAATGVAASSVDYQAGTNPTNCFTPSSTAGCIQLAPNGNISYDYGLGEDQFVYFVSVTSLNEATYSLAIDYTLSDPADNIWKTAQIFAPRDFIPLAPEWYVLETSKVARAWRIRETEGATLQIQYIVLAQPNTSGTTATDLWLTAQSETIYFIQPNKAQTGVPSWYYFDLINPPTMTVWNVPDGVSYTNFMYAQYRLPASPDQLYENLDLAPSFYDAFASGVAARLAMKENPGKAAMLDAQAARLYQQAGVANIQPVRIDFTGRGRGY